MRNEGIGSWPARRARMSPSRPAIVCGDEQLTYAELAERVARLARGLREVGVRRGDRVAYLGPNLPSFVETMFAATALGAVFVPLNTRLAAGEVQYQLEDCDARLLVFAPQGASVVEALDTGSRTVVAVAGADVSAGQRDYETLLDTGSPEPLDETVARDEPAIIMYTSGTTGRPKGAVLTHANITWNCVNVMIDVDIAHDERTLVSAPLFHVAALDMTLMPTFLKGGCSVLMSSWDVDACFDLIERHRITWMFGVTAMFAALAQSPRWETADLTSVRVLMSGGAPIPRSLIRTYQERGLTFLQGFGLTETAPGALFLGTEMSEAKAGSAGVPHFFADVRVVRPDLVDVAVGEPGEILISGPSVMPGYWNRPEATAAAFSDDGWFHSGDIGTIDEDGYVTIVDRVKDMYISGGENVYPAEVEAALFQHPAVAECAVIGVPDETWGEVGRAYVTLRPGAEASEADLIGFLDGRLARYKIPKSVRFVEEFPRTGSGKVQKAKLRRLA
jgi:fatty-acyl-CoA synthase